MDANLSRRLATGGVAIPLLVAIVVWGPVWLFAALIFTLTLLALNEYYRIVLPDQAAPQWIGVGLGSAMALAVTWLPGQLLVAAVSSILLVCFAVFIFSAQPLDEKLRALGFVLLGIFYIGFLLPQWIGLFERSDGRAWVGFVLLVVMCGDSAAYFIGRRFGRSKLAPLLSPGKTREGAWAYLVGSTAVGALAPSFLPVDIDVPEALLLACLLSILGQFGDLFESWIKRVFAVKDSGNLLPGHGGILDRIDSLIFPAVFVSAYLKVFHT